ncbi:MAG: hypothetical protein Ct9H90mP9_5650 [Pseudomonadota bacterium]|nr:MAG: hypothetical protein Ct9H90mP9_5650 [Pseudomonadota bacterium]
MGSDPSASTINPAPYTSPVIGSEKKNQSGNILGINLPGKGIGPDRSSSRPPHPPKAVSASVMTHLEPGFDPDVVFSKLPGQGSCYSPKPPTWKPHNRAFRGLKGRARTDPKLYRTPPNSFIPGQPPLLQKTGDADSPRSGHPIFNTDVIARWRSSFPALLPARNRAKIRGCFSEAFFQRGDVSDITFLNQGFWKISSLGVLKPLAASGANQRMQPLGAAGKCLNEAFSKPGGPPRDENISPERLG